jgi:hypothetical protein
VNLTVCICFRQKGQKLSRCTVMYAALYPD